MCLETSLLKLLLSGMFLQKVPYFLTNGAVMAERLRRWTRNPMGFPRAGSNPAHSDYIQMIVPSSLEYPK